MLNEENEVPEVRDVKGKAGVTELRGQQRLPRYGPEEEWQGDFFFLRKGCKGEDSSCEVMFRSFCGAKSTSVQRRSVRARALSGKVVDVTRVLTLLSGCA